eukprot:TRINITY_DN19386_c0_g2_i2.p1 TRINITY_DN19386_c0_g2~~TRINITY_DN19386_c0_g2_i2.p1  ORF type:complete len:1438 (-),score=300.70 TRINITY_DN19386_c0_g2_i2:47-4360(-)
MSTDPLSTAEPAAPSAALRSQRLPPVGALARKVTLLLTLLLVSLSVPSLFLASLTRFGDRFAGSSSGGAFAEFASDEVEQARAVRGSGRALEEASAADVGCCFEIGYGDRMVPCCLKVQAISRDSCLKASASRQHRELLGGAQGWRRRCPTNATQAAAWMREDELAANLADVAEPGPWDAVVAAALGESRRSAHQSEEAAALARPAAAAGPPALLSNNLGGRGPRKADAEELRYGGACRASNGRLVDVAIRAASPYSPGPRSAFKNGIHGMLGSINVALSTNVSLSFRVLDPVTDRPVVFERLVLALFDLDEPNEDGAYEEVSAEGAASSREGREAEVEPHDTVGQVVLRSRSFGWEGDNPVDAFHLDRIQRRRVATLLFNNASEIKVTFSARAPDDVDDYSGRNFEFAVGRVLSSHELERQYQNVRSSPVGAARSVDEMETSSNNEEFLRSQRRRRRRKSGDDDDENSDDDEDDDDGSRRRRRRRRRKTSDDEDDDDDDDDDDGSRRRRRRRRKSDEVRTREGTPLPSATEEELLAAERAVAPAVRSNDFGSSASLASEPENEDEGRKSQLVAPSLLDDDQEDSWSGTWDSTQVDSWPADKNTDGAAASSGGSADSGASAAARAAALAAAASAAAAKSLAGADLPNATSSPPPTTMPSPGRSGERLPQAMPPLPTLEAAPSTTSSLTSSSASTTSPSTSSSSSTSTSSTPTTTFSTTSTSSTSSSTSTSTATTTATSTSVTATTVTSTTATTATTTVSTSTVTTVTTMTYLPSGANTVNGFVQFYADSAIADDPQASLAMKRAIARIAGVRTDAVALRLRHAALPGSRRLAETISGEAVQAQRRRDFFEAVYAIAVPDSQAACRAVNFVGRAGDQEASDVFNEEMKDIGRSDLARVAVTGKGAEAPGCGQALPPLVQAAEREAEILEEKVTSSPTPLALLALLCFTPCCAFCLHHSWGSAAGGGSKARSFPGGLDASRSFSPGEGAVRDSLGWDRSTAYRPVVSAGYAEHDVLSSQGARSAPPSAPQSFSHAGGRSTPQSVVPRGAGLSVAPPPPKGYYEDSDLLMDDVPSFGGGGGGDYLDIDYHDGDTYEVHRPGDPGRGRGVWIDDDTRFPWPADPSSSLSAAASFDLRRPTVARTLGSNYPPLPHRMAEVIHSPLDSPSRRPRSAHMATVLHSESYELGGLLHASSFPSTHGAVSSSAAPLQATPSFVAAPAAASFSSASPALAPAVHTLRASSFPALPAVTYAAPLQATQSFPSSSGLVAQGTYAATPPMPLQGLSAVTTTTASAPSTTIMSPYQSSAVGAPAYASAAGAAAGPPMLLQAANGNVSMPISVPSQSQDRCPCGNIYMNDSNYCRKCGRPRGAAATASNLPNRGAASVPASPGFLARPPPSVGHRLHVEPPRLHAGGYDDDDGQDSATGGGVLSQLRQFIGTA